MKHGRNWILCRFYVDFKFSETLIALNHTDLWFTFVITTVMTEYWLRTGLEAVPG